MHSRLFGMGLALALVGCGQDASPGAGSGNASGSFIAGGADIGAKIVVGEDSTSGTAFVFCFTSIFTGSMSSLWWDSRLSMNMKCRDWNGVGCLVRMLACESQGRRGRASSDGRTNDRDHEGRRDFSTKRG